LNEEVIGLVQVCWDLNPDTLAREINGIKNAMNETALDSGVLITWDQEDLIDGIPVIPAWKWLLQDVKGYFELKQ
jgi:hypothetical protein